MSLDAITRMMNSFKHFEKKLDKLQDDVHYQGKALLDLRVMMMNLSAGNINANDAKSDDMKRNKIESIQNEDKTQHTPVTDKSGRSVALKALMVNQTPSLKRRLFAVNREASQQQQIQRHRKVEPVRKANTGRLQKKKSEKKKPLKVVTDS